MLSVYLKAVGLIAPGMENWHNAVSIFQQPEAYVSAPVANKLETLLPANERRRAARVTQLALHAAQQVGDADSISDCLQVFASANGDVNTFHQISLVLALAGRPVSPTRFHNSVHNAPAGYWSIATQSQTASTSLTADTNSLAAALLEAAVQVNASDNHPARDCLLVCYDEIPPVPFQKQVKISTEFACALRLSRNNGPCQTLARLDIRLGETGSASRALATEALEHLRQSNPQALVLPILETVALQRHDVITLDYFEHSMTIEVTPLAAEPTLQP